MVSKRKYRLILGTVVFFGLLAGIFSSRLGDLSELVSAKEKSAEILTRAFDICQKENDRAGIILCFKREIEPAVQSAGMTPVIEAIKESYLEEDRAAQGGITVCHDMLHAIGQLGAIHSKDPAKTLGECTSLCTSGCYHGVVEGFVSLGHELSSDFSNLCGNIGMASDRAACFHGLGHGFASIRGFNLEGALGLCGLITGISGKKDCGAGVIMELFEPASFGNAPLKFPEDIPGFCLGLAPPHDETCDHTAGLHEYARSNDEKRAIAVCQKVPAARRSNCIAALGQNMYFALQGDPEKIISFCGRVPGDLRPPCLAGALEASSMSDPRARHGAAICAQMQSESGWCWQALGTSIEFYHGKGQGNK